MESIDLEHIKELSERILKNPDLIDDLSAEESQKVRNYMNPYGTILNCEKSYALLSIINWKDRYMRKFITTALVGYIYRLAEEYELESEVEKCKKKWGKLIDKDPANKKQYFESMEKEIELINTTARRIVKSFLNRHFEFNPDKHVSVGPVKDIEKCGRVAKQEYIKKLCTVAEVAPTVESKMKSDPEKMFQYNKNSTLFNYQSAVEIKNLLKSCISCLIEPDYDKKDVQGILLKKYKQFVEVANDMKNLVEPLSAAETLKTLEVNPPADVFYHFDRYLTNHYEQLKDICS